MSQTSPTLERRSPYYTPLQPFKPTLTSTRTRTHAPPVYVEGLQEEVSAASANAAESIRMTADTLALNSQASKKMIAMVQERVDAAQKEVSKNSLLN